ncbi:MAG: hypothetical protein D8M57_10285 [Candidatus Scalindua sp. AMX11]|nr:MAG: hypothetical protein DWQ00_01420 [Candidatus Scalindua sp.]NOG85559.1 SPASM domain-containing protein [Planctomycetota bacterium]RZV90192.1 MAG: hypothetical protein EX341_06030 [Candidatus Scalindua sp. SCAELEC01]TDE64976.1 MAG: hypothetical protein D8M57_10285 [Candidatus Scalindua sp. AMX11]
MAKIWVEMRFWFTLTGAAFDYQGSIWTGEMASIQITTQIGCRNSCDYCPQDLLIEANRKTDGSLIMTFDTFKTCVKKIPLQVAIWFAGMCEPWSNPKCTKMLLYAHEQGHGIGVFTTLVGMSTADLDLLQLVPFQFFRIHLPSKSGIESIKISDNYLRCLGKVISNGIPVTFHCHDQVVPEVVSILDQNGYRAELRSLYRRAGNISVSGRLKAGKRRGAIACQRRSRSNVLLPNGDVLLCSNDYGMKHTLGNLLETSYESLFTGSEFQKIQRGQTDESLDVLCRYCDNFAYDLDAYASLQNWSYHIDRFLYYPRRIRSWEDALQLLGKVRFVVRNASRSIFKGK